MDGASKTSTRQAVAEGDIRSAVGNYRAYHDDGGGNVDARKSNYQDMVRSYYDLVTDFYEKGWGDSFHFAPRARGEDFALSIQRHQHYLALKLGLRPGMRVLDIGCGVGGPMRSIARFSGAHITGVNVNAYQLGKAKKYNAEQRLDGLCDVLEADFMKIPRPDASVDAIYAIEATCHAPDKTALLRELHRLLKPGGRIAIYEWCLTAKHDPNDAAHLAAKRGIEEGNGLPDIATIPETARAFEDAGFRVLEQEDRLAAEDPEVPWHNSLAGREVSKVGLQRSAAGQTLVGALIKTLEATRIAPKGTREVQEFLSKGADALVAAGDMGTFTPMAFFLAEKR
jgi:sterol 24-C-methyltransferase